MVIRHSHFRNFDLGLHGILLRRWSGGCCLFTHFRLRLFWVKNVFSHQTPLCELRTAGRPTRTERDRGQRSEVGGQKMSSLRGEKTEVGGQRTEIRRQKRNTISIVAEIKKFCKQRTSSILNPACISETKNVIVPLNVL